MREVRIDGPFTGRTKDGLSVNISCVFQYQLMISLDNILHLYYKWGPDQYEKAFARLAKGIIREAVADFNAMFVVTGRTTLEENMRSTLSSLLNEENAELRNFQLFEIQLPENFTKVIQNMERSKQEYISTTYKLKSAEIYAEGNINKELEKNSIIISEANAYNAKMNYVQI